MLQNQKFKDCVNYEKRLHMTFFIDKIKHLKETHQSANVCNSMWPLPYQTTLLVSNYDLVQLNMSKPQNYNLVQCVSDQGDQSKTANVTKKKPARENLQPR